MSGPLKIPAEQTIALTADDDGIAGSFTITTPGPRDLARLCELLASQRQHLLRLGQLGEDLDQVAHQIAVYATIGDASLAAEPPELADLIRRHRAALAKLHASLATLNRHPRRAEPMVAALEAAAELGRTGDELIRAANPRR